MIPHRIVAVYKYILTPKWLGVHNNLNLTEFTERLEVNYLLFIHHCINETVLRGCFNVKNNNTVKAKILFIADCIRTIGCKNPCQNPSITHIPLCNSMVSTHHHNKLTLSFFNATKSVNISCWHIMPSDIHGFLSPKISSFIDNTELPTRFNF
jgi:hypothetical protein